MAGIADNQYLCHVHPNKSRFVNNASIFYFDPRRGSWVFLDNGFQPSTSPVTVASDNVSKNSLSAILMVFLLILQISSLGSFESVGKNGVKLDNANDRLYTSPLQNLALDYGSDVIGQTISHDGLIDAEIGHTGNLYSYSDKPIFLDAVNLSSQPDITFSDNLELNACWVTTDGKVIHYKIDKFGEANQSVVDVVNANQDVNQIPPCAITVKENGRVSILYSNGTDIKSAQIAYQSPLYSDGNDWHTRTIFENAFPTVFALSIMPDQHEWGVYTDDTGRLYNLKYTGAFWEKTILDYGPIGNDVAIEIDDSGRASVLYTKQDQAILMSVFNGVSESEIISESQNLTSDIGLTLDHDGLVQLYTSEFADNTTNFDVRRSLINQKNQISNEPLNQLDSLYPNTSIEQIGHGDFNGDDYDDVVYSEPDADANGLTNNGIISLHLGSAIGLEQTASLTFSGTQNHSNLGKALAIADFDGDGYSDIAIGSPGHNNNDGLVQFIFGSDTILSSELEEISGLSNPQSTGEHFGINLEPVEDLNSDGNDELLICSKLLQGADTGKVTLYSGGAQDSVWVEMSSPDQLLLGQRFGQSISASGDINGDGFADLVIGNSGDLEQNTGYSSVEVRYGDITGYSVDPDISYQSSMTGALFGYDVEIINDLNGDGLDEIIITEPYNLSGDFNAGSLWVFLGNSTSISTDPDYRINGETNQQIGLNVESIGDTNMDGYNDFTAVSRDEDGNGIVRLYSGGPGDFTSSYVTIARGEQSLGLTSSLNLDTNGDGLAEYLFSQENMSSNGAYYSSLYHYTRNLWQNIEISVDGDVANGEIQTSQLGDPSIIYFSESDFTKQLHMITSVRGEESKVWSYHNITADSSKLISANFEITSSGEPVIILSVDGLGVYQKSYDSRVLLEDRIFTGNSDSAYLDMLGENGEYYLAYYSQTSNKIFLNTYSNGLWSEQIVASGYQINHDLAVQLDDNSEPIIFFRDSLSNDIFYAKFNQTWQINPLGTNGQATGEAFDVIKSESGEFLLVCILDDGNFANLTLITSNLTSHVTELIGFESDLDIDISIMQDSEETIIVAGFSQSGTLSVYEKPSDDSNWNQQLLEQPLGSIYNNQVSLSGHNNPVIMVNSELNSLHIRQESTWSTLADMPEEIAPSMLEVYSNDNTITLVTENSATSNLQWNTLYVENYSDAISNWYSSEMGHLTVDGEVVLTYDSNNTINLVVKEQNSPDLFNLRAYIDQDSDYIFDAIDELPHTPNQWIDEDDDGFGDNPHGPESDDCPNTPGTSAYLTQGCNDLDGDGYDDLIDDCNAAYGFSWIDLNGCSDFDQDGWSDYNSVYRTGDVFPDNWKQAFDSDGDSYGDNHGPDCCDTWYDSDARAGDLFPFNPRQYTDYDNDGYGDNSSDFLTGDACKFEYGTSYRDRLGCLDSDGDGASDASGFWNTSLGADLWPNDQTQWADSDGDGYGDNSSVGATNPDLFPNNIAATNDTDNDGFPDIFTQFYNGTNSGGLYIDGCPLVSGNSTNPLFGCLDSDGDSFMDLYSFDVNAETGLRANQTGDAFPNNPQQWSDLDGDGFGDLQGYPNSDICPNLVGVLNGTIGVGCPLIDDNDDDGDLVINEIDQCPETQLGMMVNQFGCALYQIDSDDDGIFDDIDTCPDSAVGVPVDSSGCTEEQRNSDVDNDGIPDLQDICPNTPQGETSNDAGCSSSQSDTDSDGVYDNQDLCPDTPLGYIVDSNGCVDEEQNNVDYDLDGYSGIYRYEVNPDNGLRFNQSGDLFPNDPTQWWDTDGDSYGDNSSAVGGDSCLLVSGTSFFDRYGCADSDNDGWSDPTLDWFASPSGLADAFPNDSSQWRDSDGDSHGDNSSGLSPDLCPSTNPAFLQEVDKNGCAPYERDTDNDGVVDSLDNCPTQEKGIDGYLDGCPLVKQTDSTNSNQILGLPITWFIAIVVGIVLLLVVIIMRRRRGYDDENWYDEDDDDEDDFEEDRLSFLDRRPNRQQKQPSAPIRKQIQAPVGPPPSGPTWSPPERSTGPPNKPPTRLNAPASGPPKSATKTVQHNNSSSTGKKAAKKVKKSEANGKKVRRAVVEVEEDIFENVAQSSIDESVNELSNYSFEDERQLLMYLQEKGWNAPQSRVIINMAKIKSRQ